MSLHKDPEWLRIQYVDLGRSGREIAESLGVKTAAVNYRLRIHGLSIPRRTYADRWKDRECRVCGATFTPAGSHALYCSDACQFGTSTCTWCEEVFVKRRMTGQYKGALDHSFCSYACRIADRQDKSQGDRREVAGGYLEVRVPPGTLGRVKPGGWMIAHRYVMQESIGRPLERHETVHHINGDKQDNRLENLQLRTGNHGNGAAFECFDCGSHNVGAVEIKDST